MKLSSTESWARPFWSCHKLNLSEPKLKGRSTGPRFGSELPIHQEKPDVD